MEFHFWFRMVPTCLSNEDESTFLDERLIVLQANEMGFETGRQISDGLENVPAIFPEILTNVALLNILFQGTADLAITSLDSEFKLALGS